MNKSCSMEAFAINSIKGSQSNRQKETRKGMINEI